MYGSYRHIIHHAKSGTSSDIYRLEIQKKNFIGSSVEWLADAESGAFIHFWDEINPDNLWSNPVQKSELEVMALVQDAADFAIIEEIFSADEDEFRLVKKVNGTTVWTGKVLPGLMRWDESGYPFPASIIAKDLSHTSGEAFALEDERETIITTLARLLPYDLPIHSYTSWTENNMPANTDWLAEIYHDTIVFRDVDDLQSVVNQTWTKYRVLSEIAKAGRLIIRQDAGVWNIFQISALASPASVRRFVYDAAGASVSSGLVNLTEAVDQDVLIIKPSSVNENKEALKETGVIFNHQSGSSELVFPKIPGFTYPGGAVDMGGASYYLASQTFTGNGDEYIDFNARIEQEVSATSSQDLYYAITIGDYFLRPDPISGALSWRNSVNAFIDTYAFANKSGINTTTGQITTASEFLPSGGFPFQNGVPVRLERSTAVNLPDGYAENTTYYIIDFNDTGSFFTFKLSDTPGGSAVIPTSTGDGSFYVFQISAVVDLFKSGAVQTGNIISVQTPVIPDAAEGNLSVYLPAYAVGDFSAVYWFFTSLSISNPTQSGASIEYRLTQSGAYSLIDNEEDPEEIYFSDGPYNYSRSSYRHSASLADITSSMGWNRRTGASIPNTSHVRLWLREALDLRRSARRCLFAELHGTFSTEKVITHRSKNYFFLGGRQTGYRNNYSAELFEINLEIDV